MGGLKTLNRFDAEALASQGMPVPPAVEFRAATKLFEMEDGPPHLAVDNVSLSLAPGEFLCVLGPSGHGKSTMLNLLAGFIEPTSGYVLHAGNPVAGPGPERGVVFQRDTLFPWKRVGENIRFGLRARGEPREAREKTVAHFLKAIGLEQFARAYPYQLSGGMRRRVAIAAVLANRPDLLLMDEPFTGLDYVRRKQLCRLLEDLWSDIGCTVFFITHDLDEAPALADRVVIVMRGRVVFEQRIDFARPRTADFLASEEASDVRRTLMRELARVDGGRCVTAAPLLAPKAESATARPRPRLPRAPVWIANTAILLALWQIASWLAGRTAAGAHMVPSLYDIATASKLLGNYWPGGLGLERTPTGAPLTWLAAFYALFYNSIIRASRSFVCSAASCWVFSLASASRPPCRGRVPYGGR
jgi:ABC-type nitrate/sulfonate/bicarbonate transport system ATPase subunit